MQPDPRSGPRHPRGRTDRRSIPSEMPSSARTSGGSRWWVVVAGWVMQALGVAEIVRDADDRAARWRAGRPPPCRPRPRRPPACRRPSSAAAPARPGDDRRGPGRAPASTPRLRGQEVGDPRARLAACAATRTGSVSSPFSSTQALNGESAGPVWRSRLWTWVSMKSRLRQDHAAEAAPLPVDVLGRRIDDAIGAERRAGSAAAASRRRCRPRAWRRPRWAISATAAMSTSSSVGLVGLSRNSVLVLRPHGGAPLVEIRAVDERAMRRRSAAAGPRPRSGRSRTGPWPRPRGRRPSPGPSGPR